MCGFLIKIDDPNIYMIYVNNISTMNINNEYSNIPEICCDNINKIFANTDIKTSLNSKFLNSVLWNCKCYLDMCYGCMINKYINQFMNMIDNEKIVISYNGINNNTGETNYIFITNYGKYLKIYGKYKHCAIMSLTNRPDGKLMSNDYYEGGFWIPVKLIKFINISKSLDITPDTLIFVKNNMCDNTDTQASNKSLYSEYMKNMEIIKKDLDLFEREKKLFIKEQILFEKERKEHYKKYNMVMDIETNRLAIERDIRIFEKDKKDHYIKYNMIVDIEKEKLQIKKEKELLKLISKKLDTDIGKYIGSKS